MAGIGDLWFSLRGDNRTLIKDANAAGDVAGAGFGQRFKKAFAGQGVGAAFTQGVGIGGGLSTFNLISKGIAAVTDGIFGAVAAASAMNESLGKSQVVFGDSAAEMEQWASTAADAFGQSKQQALEAAGTYGNLFQAFGLGQKEAAGMSKSLVELAADLASFNNTSVDDALVALRSGLSGETEPLKRYGIALSDARMRADLMARGVKNLGTTLTPLQKSQAAYNIIMHDSALAQGDFSRTSSGLANTQRILNAKMADLSAEIGAKLLPVMVTLAHVVSEDVIPAVEGFVGSISRLGENTAKEFAAIDKGARDLAWPLANLGDAFRTTAEQAQVHAETIDKKWAEMGRLVKDDVYVAAKAIKTVGEAADDAAEETGVALGKIVTSFTTTRSALNTAASGAADAIYGPIVAKADWARIRREQAEDKQTLASKKATKEQKLDAEKRMLENNQKSIEVLATLATYGDKSAKKTLTTMIETMKATKGLSVEQIAALDALLAKLNEVVVKYRSFPRDRFDPRGGRAGGGYVPPGWFGSVGERGSEGLMMFPGGGGMVIPHSGSVASSHAGGGTQHVEIGGTAHVIHSVDAAAMRLAKAMGYDEQRLARALVDASGLVTNLHQAAAMR